MQSSDQEPDGTLQASRLSDAKDDAELNPWILDLLFSGSFQRHRGLGSLVLGLMGTVLIALVCCCALPFASFWLSNIPMQSEFTRTAYGVAALLIVTATIVTSLFSAQLIAFCHLPISVRLSLIIGLIVAGLTICTLTTDASIGADAILFCLPFCLGGFTLRRLASLRAIHWPQKIEDRKISIFWMMDVTSAIAILIALIAATPEFDYRGLICYVPVTLLFASFGFPLCARINALSLSKTARETGFGLWIAVNVFVAALVFLIFVSVNGNSPVALIGLVAAPSMVAVAHYSTEIQIRWLRGCGWTFISLNKIKHETEEL